MDEGIQLIKTIDWEIQKLQRGDMQTKRRKEKKNNLGKQTGKQ